MKKTIIFSALVLGISGLIAQDGPVREVQAVLAMSDGTRKQGFIQNSNDQALLFATASGGQGAPVPYTQIAGDGLNKAIFIEERAEALSNARNQFSAGNYPEAAAMFGQVARNYAILLNAPQNFASEAFFYHMESLRRAGQYGSLLQLAESKAGKTVEAKLGEAYQHPYQMIKLWGMLGAKKMEDLKAALEAYQEPVVGEAKLLPAPKFKEMQPAEAAQLSYLRAKVYEAEGDKKNALDDYYRAFTLGHGYDPLLSKLAMGAAMTIQAEDPGLAKESDRAVAEMQSLAFTFSKRFGTDIMPEDIRKYAQRPPLPKFTAPPEEEKPAAENSEEAKPGTEKGEAEKEGE